MLPHSLLRSHRPISNLLTASTRLNDLTRQFLTTPTMSSSNDPIHKDGAKSWASSDGQFKRQVSSFRESIGPESKHKPAKDRYKLIVAYACPWAHRAMIVRQLKGIDRVEGLLPMYVVDSLLGPEGWTFPPYGDTHEDLKGLGIPGTGYIPGHEDKKRIRDFYLAADPNYSARSTVPIIWDEELKTVVNNESAEIIRMLNEGFDEFLPQDKKGVNYYPQELRKEIDELNSWVYDTVSESENLSSGVVREKSWY